MLFHRDLEAALHVCPRCGHHLRIGPAQRFAMTFDGGKYQELPAPTVPADPLRFRDERRYGDRMKDARAKTARDGCRAAI